MLPALLILIVIVLFIFLLLFAYELCRPCELNTQQAINKAALAKLTIKIE